MSNIEGMDRLVEYLEGLADAVSQGMEDGLKTGMGHTVEAAKLRAPVRDGQLRNSITSRVETSGNEIEGIVSAAAAYAGFVELGTGPKGEENHGGISPNVSPVYRTKGWVFISPKTGEFVYTKGFRARPFMYPAFKQTAPLIKQEVRDAVRKKMGGE